MSSDEDQALPPRYQHLAFLGQGSFGEVRKVKDLKTERTVALKITKASNGSVFIGAAMIEELTLQYLNLFDEDGFVVKLIRTDVSQGDRFMALEQMPGNFIAWMDRFHPKGVPLPVMKTVCRRLFSAMRFLKERGVIHGDIKPDNFLMASASPDSLKLADFGMARRLFVEGQTVCLSDDSNCPYFRPPEAILGYETDYAADMWNVGVSLFYAVTNIFVFPSNNNKDLVNDMLLLLGMPPTSILKKGSRIRNYFCVATISTGTIYFPKHRIRGIRCFPHLGIKQLLTCISQHTLVSRDLPSVAAYDFTNFCDLICNLLTYDPADRLTPQQALEHAFVC